MNESNTIPTSYKREWWKNSFGWTAWKDKQSPQGIGRETSWLAWYHELLAAPPTIPSRAALPGWAPTIFQGDYRHLSRVVRVAALVLDPEPPKGSPHPGAPIDQIHEVWAGCAHLIHGTYSNGLPSGEGGLVQHRYRVILPMTRDVTRDEHARLLRWAFRRMEHLLIDTSTSDASRLWFVPALRPGQERLEAVTHWNENVLDPGALLATLPAEDAPPPKQPRPTSHAPADTANPAYVQAALDKAARAIHEAPEGGRNNLLNQQAYALGGLVGAGAVGRQQVIDLLVATTRAAGWTLPRKNLATIERGVDDGAAAPRSVPAPPTRRWERPARNPGEPTREPPPWEGPDEPPPGFYGEPSSEQTPEVDPPDPPPPPPAPGGGAGGSDDDEPPDERPVVVLSANRIGVLDEAMRHLGEARTVYQRSGQIVEPIAEWIATQGTQKRRATAQIRSLHQDRLEELLSRAILFHSWDAKLEDYKPTPPPKWLVNQVYHRGTWETILPLRGVVESPVLRPDGTLLASPGYDDATGLIYLPSTTYPAVDPYPTEEAVKEALGLLCGLVKDFPFETRAHRSAWIAALLTPLCRPAFEGPAPLFLVDANVRSAGKTRLVHLIGLIVQGAEIASMANVNDDVEMEKRILGVAKAGDLLTLIDDIGTSTFGTPSLNNALTSTRFRGRTLGVTDLAAYDLLTTWFATGNNVQLYRDLTRRICHIRLQSAEQHPEYRELPDIMAEVKANRARYLNAALTLILGWFAAGKPHQALKSWGSFEGWSSLIRQIVVWLGEPDPGEVREWLTENADTEALALGALIEGWATLQDRMGKPEGLTVQEALKETESCKETVQELQELYEAILALCPGPSKELPKQLGRRLTHLRDRVVDGRCLSRSERRNKAGMVWTVIQARRHSWKEEL